MSARSDLAVGAQLKLCSRVSSAVICMRQYFCGALQHSLYLFFPTVSMRLRLKRYHFSLKSSWGLVGFES